MNHWQIIDFIQLYSPRILFKTKDPLIYFITLTLNEEIIEDLKIPAKNRFITFIFQNRI